MSAGFTPEWLDLRESADADARAIDLARAAAALVPDDPGAHPVVHDLGCGTGSMMRWLAPRLPAGHRWVLHDRDPDLLRRAAARPGLGAGGTPVDVRTHQGDVTELTSGDLAGARLVTASALLDLLTGAEVRRVVAGCVGVGCPALLTLSVCGQVELDPGDDLDAEIAAAFDAHQRRGADRSGPGDRLLGRGDRLLGPDAADVAAEEFARAGYAVARRPSPWRLRGDRSALTLAWLTGWVAAAAEQRPQLPTAAYLRRRREAAEAGELAVVVGHTDLLATESFASTDALVGR